MNLLNNPYINALVNARQILDTDQLRKCVIMLIVLFLNALLDILSLVSIYPLTYAAANPSIMDRYWVFIKFKGWLGVEGNNMQFLFYLSLGVLFFFIVKTIFAFIISFVQMQFVLNISSRLSQKVFQKYYDNGHLYINSIDSGKKYYDVIHTPYFFSVSYLIETLNLTSEIIVLLLIFIVILFVQPMALMILILLIVPIFLIVYLYTKNKTKNLGDERNVEFPKLMAITLDSMNAYNDVILSNKESFFLENFKRRLNSIKNIDSLQIGIYNKVPQRLNDIVMGLGIAIIFGNAYFFGQSPSDIISILGIFAISAYRFLPSVNRIMGALLNIKAYSYTATELNDIKNTSLKKYQTVSTLVIKEKLELVNISYKYTSNNNIVIDGISISIHKGDTIGFIGGSGSGKTTLLNIILRFLEQTNGKLLVDNVEIDAKIKSSYQKSIGYVQQNVFIKNGTLLENIAFGEESSEIDHGKMNFAIEHSMLSEMVKDNPLGKEIQLGESGANLSGGQKQRVGIARALYKDAQILIFDEATSALDAETERGIVNTIKNLTKLNKIIIIVAHRISTLEMCDRIFKIDQGKIIEELSYEQLLKKN